MSGTSDTSRARRPGATGVHSIQRFVLSVPSLDDAERFYRAFGLDVRRAGGGLELRAFGDPHVWGAIHQGPQKRLEYVEMGMYAEDADALARSIAKHGAGRAPHRLGPQEGLWAQLAEMSPPLDADRPMAHEVRTGAALLSDHAARLLAASGAH